MDGGRVSHVVGGTICKKRGTPGGKKTKPTDFGVFKTKRKPGKQKSSHCKLGFKKGPSGQNKGKELGWGGGTNKDYHLKKIRASCPEEANDLVYPPLGNSSNGHLYIG